MEFELKTLLKSTLLICIITLTTNSLYSQKVNKNSPSKTSLATQLLDSLVRNSKSEFASDSYSPAINDFYFEMDEQDHPERGQFLDSLYNWGVSILSNNPKFTRDLLFPLWKRNYSFSNDQQNERAGKILNILAISCRRTGQQADILEIYRSSLLYFKQCKKIDPILAPAIYNNMANTYKDLGDLYHAVEFASEGSRQCEQSLLVQNLNESQITSLSKNLASMLMNLGLIEASIQKHSEAISHFTRALELAPKYNPGILSKIHNNLAISLAQELKIDSADEHFQAAIQLSKEIKSDLSLQYRLNYSNFLSRFSPSEFMINQNLLWKDLQAIPASSARNELMSLCLFNEAIYYENSQDFEKSIRLLRQAFLTLQGYESRIGEEIPLKEIPAAQKPFNSLDILVALSNTLVKKGNLNNDSVSFQSALNYYTFAENLIDSLRSNLNNQESKILLNQRQKETYQAKADLCADLFVKTQKQIYLSELFSTCEKGKSAGLWSEIQQANLKSDLIPKAMLETEYRLKDSLAQLNEQLANPNSLSTQDINETRARRINISTQIDSLLQQYNSQFPEYYNLKFSTNTASLQDIQNKIEASEAFIQFYFTKKKLHQLVILKDTLIYRSIGPAENILERLDHIIEMNSSPRLDYTSQDVQNYQQETYQLYIDLIAPIKAQLTLKKLIIAPDSRLALMPFEALVQDSTYSYQTDFRDLKYLIYDHQFVYTYTASLWMIHQLEVRKKKAKGKLLAFAPYYSRESSSTSFLDRFGTDLSPLPGTLEEVKHLRRKFKSQIYMREKATEENFKEDFQKAEILHFAMHTINNEEEPLQSSLVFSPSPDKELDGRLTGEEILNTRIPASLAVLSACNTGSGTSREGEGIIGLSRSFMQAGCPSLILNLWIMDDTNGKRMIKSFYNFLAKGQTSGEALHQAKLNHLQQAHKLYAHPHYWAGLILLGQNSTVPLQSRKIPGWSLYLSLALLGVIVILLRKK